MSVIVGEIPLLAPSWNTSVGETANDKPASMWVCPLDNLMKDDAIQVELSCDPQHVKLVLQPGQYFC